MIDEDFEMALFEAKKHFVSNAIVPTLFAKKLKSLHFILYNSSIEIGIKWLAESELTYQISDSASAVDFIRIYENQISNLKLKIFNSHDFESLKLSVIELIDIQLAYESVMCNYFENSLKIRLENFNENVKIADAVSSSDLIKALQKVELENEIFIKEFSRIKKHKELLTK